MFWFKDFHLVKVCLVRCECDLKKCETAIFFFCRRHFSHCIGISHFFASLACFSHLLQLFGALTVEKWQMGQKCAKILRKARCECDAKCEHDAKVVRCEDDGLGALDKSANADANANFFSHYHPWCSVCFSRLKTKFQYEKVCLRDYARQGKCRLGQDIFVKFHASSETIRPVGTILERLQS